MKIQWVVEITSASATSSPLNVFALSDISVKSGIVGLDCCSAGEQPRRNAADIKPVSDNFMAGLLNDLIFLYVSEVKNWLESGSRAFCSARFKECDDLP